MYCQLKFPEEHGCMESGQSACEGWSRAPALPPASPSHSSLNSAFACATMTVVMTVVIRKRRPIPSSPAARRVGNRTIPRHELGSRIQETALQLFRERGFDNISVDEIVAASGVAKGTFFNFFPTKQAVLSGYYRDLDSFMTARLQRLNPADP